MKATLLTIVCLACTAVAGSPVQEPVSVVLGPKAYRDGDVIEITEVTATSSKLEQGDSITVRGRVRLDSRSAASLCLLVTQTQGDGLEETDAGQTKQVASGLSNFELKATIKHKGVLHLTLYDLQTGKPLGGTYFGTAEQMSGIRDWSVQYYLAE